MYVICDVSEQAKGCRMRVENSVIAGHLKDLEIMLAPQHTWRSKEGDWSDHLP